MRNKSERKYIKLVRILLSVTVIALMLVSCRNNKDKSDHSSLIPEKPFVSILTDVYMADGLLSLRELRSIFSKRDSISNYLDIIESYGYSYETMNSTINYYFVNKPKKLIKIYDQVIKNLSEIQSGIQNKIISEMAGKAVKTMGNKAYYLPDTTLKEPPGFKYTISTPGTYTLTFTVTIYPDDQSFNPSFTSWYCNADSAETGKRIYLPPIKYIKDGHRHTFTIKSKAPSIGLVNFYGLFYDYENNPDEWGKHARIENISFSFTGMMPL
jgi:hypothetical protein